MIEALKAAIVLEGEQIDSVLMTRMEKTVKLHGSTLHSETPKALYERTLSVLQDWLARKRLLKANYVRWELWQTDYPDFITITLQIFVPRTQI